MPNREKLLAEFDRLKADLKIQEAAEGSLTGIRVAEIKARMRIIVITLENMHRRGE